MTRITDLRPLWPTGTAMLLVTYRDTFGAIASASFSLWRPLDGAGWDFAAGKWSMGVADANLLRPMVKASSAAQAGMWGAAAEVPEAQLANCHVVLHDGATVADWFAVEPAVALSRKGMAVSVSFKITAAAAAK